MENVKKFLESYYSDNKYIFNLEDLYILLEKLTLKERKEFLIQVYQYNKKLQNQAVKVVKQSSNIPIIQEDEAKIEFSKPKQNKKVEALNLDVSNYLNKLKSVTNEEEILNILPKRDESQFENILDKIIIELYKEKVEILNFIHFQKEDIINFFQEELDEIEFKIEYILDYKDYEEENYKSENNKIIFLKNNFNEPIIFNDLNGCEEYYDSFLKLIKRIQTGNFKKMRNFTNNNKIVDIMEVKGFKTRILYSRIAEDTYVVLSAFVKKCNTDLKHRNILQNVSLKYQLQKDTLLNNVKNSSFMANEKLYYDELIEMLSEKKKVKKYEIN